jgi:hypothetical protein
MKRTVPVVTGLLALTDVERAVLAVLAEGRTTSSVVRLAADLYGRSESDRFTYGDPIGFVSLVLEDLNAQGLVKYRVPRPDEETAPGWGGLPYHIRLTPKGWAEAGYPHIIIEVGRSSITSSMREVSVLDRTDYRTHDTTAEGGPIDRHMYWACPTLYPPKKESSMVDQELVLPTRDELRRAYIRVTPEMEERVIASYGRTGSYEKTAKETNLDQRRVRYIVNDRPRLKRDSSSLKERVLALITEKGPYVDVLALHRDIPGAHGLHNLVHILHSLHKGQLIDFRTERSATGGGTNYLAIRVRAKQAGTNGRELAPTSSVEAELAPTSEASDLTVELPENFPELNRLLAYAEQTASARAKADQYLAAAERLSDVDPAMADILIAKATAIDTAILSPVESEYLAYAKAHPRS